MYGQVRVRGGHSYQVVFNLHLPSASSYDAEGRITLPARGEFHGRLGVQPLRFAVRDTLAKVTQARSITAKHDDGSIRMTPGATVDREVIDQVLTWGRNERHGWRVGALLVGDLVSDKPIAAGETIAVQYFLQNVGDAPQTIRVLQLSRSSPVLGERNRINLNAMHSSEIVEFTAQPGEGVSPDGFVVRLDTTGFPDGAYSIYTTSAFWLPKEGGRGGSSPWRVGSVSMTIGEGKPLDTKATTDEDAIVWGIPTAGLRVGMRLKQGERRWPVGSLLEGQLYVKNVTDRPITFEWDQPLPLDQNQVVLDSNGDYVRLKQVFFTGIRPRNPRSFTVKEGEQIQLGTALLKSAAEASEIRPNDPAQLVATSDKFTWQVFVELPQKSIPGVTIIAGSGPVPFEIVHQELLD
jgi:hypothetical protein